MANKKKYYSISNFERLPPTGDAKKWIIHYSIADDSEGLNKKNLNIIINLSGSIKLNSFFENNLEMAIISYIQNEIERSIIQKDKLQPKITITSYEKNFPPNEVDLDFEFGKWKEVVIESKLGFLGIN